MTISSLLPLIDAEIAVLKRARALLTATEVETVKPTRGRSKGSTNPTAKPKKKRNLSPEGRARIAAAVKRRWANQKKAAKA